MKKIILVILAVVLVLVITAAISMAFWQYKKDSLLPTPLSTPSPSEEPQTICIEIYQPVCGVDGKTYGNDCFAKIADVEIDYEGECK